jgi:hypothetical protein
MQSIPMIFPISSLASALIGAGGALIVALVVAYIGYKRYLHERAHQQETLLNALFGELANIYEHYSYAKNELPTSTSDAKELRLRLQWSKYGKLQSTENIDQYGFLSASDIRLFLQLGLRIRNNDVLLDLLLADIPAMTQDDLASANKRMDYPIETTRDLINRLVEKRPGLRNVLIVIEKDLGTI